MPRFTVPAEVEPVEGGMRPTFSIVMAAYRSSATIAVALDSALEQTLPPREVVVGYRHAADDPLEEALALFGDRVVALRVDEGGPTAALNAAIEASTGDFVANLDADDRLLPGYLEALAELGARYPSLDMLASDLWLEEHGQRVGRFYERHAFPRENQHEEMLRRNFALWPAIRRERLLEVQGMQWGLFHSYDWEFFIRLVLTGSRVGLVDEPLWVYGLHEQSLAWDKAAIIRARATILEQVLERDDLSAGERAAAEAAYEPLHLQNLFADVETALVEGRRDARRRALELLRTPGVSARGRAKALAAVVAPRLAGRHLARGGPSLRQVRKGFSDSG